MGLGDKKRICEEEKHPIIKLKVYKFSKISIGLDFLIFIP